MKITCDSCGSKYTIADAKVKGRKVKVRCKGCKESILVDGTQLDEAATGEAAPAETAPAEAALAAPGAESEVATAKKDTWSVNLSDDDSREMTLDELVQAWKSGEVTSDAYVWKDGMGDWKPILEVGELKLKLGGPTSSGVVSSAAAPPVASGGKMDDLFGGVDLAGSGAGAERPLQAGAGTAAKPTGARNDSSVLFSLDNLNPASGSPRKENAGDDIFGNLGMGAGTLNTNTDLLTAPAKDPPPAPAGARVAAPSVAAAPSGKSKMGPIVGGILGVAVLVGGAFFFLGGSDESAQAEEDPAELAAIEEQKKKAEEERQKAEEERKKMAAKLEKMQEELKEKEAEAKEPAKEEEKKEEPEPDEKEQAAASSSTSGSDSSTSAPKPSGPPPFNIPAAKSALSSAAANAAGCKKPGGPTGSGKVQITFSTSGRVTSATVVSGPFGGTAVGGCVASTFRRARVPAFSGSPQTVAKSFRIP